MEDKIDELFESSSKLENFNLNAESIPFNNDAASDENFELQDDDNVEIEEHQNEEEIPWDFSPKFDEENLKYLSSDQKKALTELKKCKDNGDSFSKEQQETLHSIADSIIKGKLGDEKYKDFKCLMEKKRSNQTLTDEENNKLKEYRDILNGSKHTAKDILNQFLR